MFYFYLSFFFVLGALLGSFANVLIFRIPENKSVISPRSTCPSCNSLIPWFCNVPIFAWLVLRGRCYSCKSPISVQYLIIEILMGALFAAAFWRFGLGVTLIEMCLLIFALLVISAIDLRHMIIPDIFSLSGIVIGLIGSLFNPNRSFVDSILGVLAGGGILLVLSLAYYALKKREGLGGGDIKLLAWLGAVLGWQSVPFIIFVSSLLGSCASLFVILKMKKGLSAAIPFGPFLALAGLLYAFFGGEIISWYYNLSLLP